MGHERVSASRPRSRRVLMVVLVALLALVALGSLGGLGVIELGVWIVATVAALARTLRDGSTS
jgi:hypothetical protein